MQLTIDTTGVDAAITSLRALPRRLQKAVADGLTATARKVREAEQAEMRDVFDRPTPWTLGSVFVRQARADQAVPEAVVGIANDTGGQRAATGWLRWQVFGGLRTQTAFERLLVGAGAMSNDARMVPGQFARLDAYGNISRGQLVQILSQLRIESSSGSTRSLPRFAFEDTRKDRLRKSGVIRRAYKRAGGQYVAFPQGRGKLRPGIYLIRATAFGRTDPKPVLIFVSKAEYEAGRFDFHDVAQRVAGAQLQPLVDAAIRKAIES